MAERFPAAVLFDLDGTLLDSAPDFFATLAVMAERRGWEAPADALIRPVVSKGSRAMLAAAFPQLAQDQREALVDEFLDTYQDLIGQHARLFDGVEPMLQALEQAGCRWGIVTNKPEYLAQLILPQHGWQQRCAVLVGGDTLAEKKPHPLPLLHAAQAIAVPPGQCVYVGDDQRDIQAAQAAGMPSVAALWGYRLADDVPQDWGADCLHESAATLSQPAAWPQVIHESEMS